MASFAIIEVEDGLTVTEVLPGQSADDAAASEGGVLVDPGPFESYEEAMDALTNLEEEGHEDR